LRDQREIVGELKPLAVECCGRAHAPYSGVKVGAVAQTADGATYPGCNVENASYGLTQCAERNALANAIAAGATPGTIVTLLVYSSDFDALSPCGACRQVMVELMAGDARVISCSDSGAARSWGLGELLPEPFALSPPG